MNFWVPLIPQKQLRLLATVTALITTGYSGYVIGYTQASRGEKSFFNLIQPNASQASQEKRSNNTTSLNLPPASAPFPFPSQTASPSPSSIPSHSVSATSLPESTNKFQVKYEKGEYPERQCGRVIGTPKYPIFIQGSRSDYRRVREDFCNDAEYIEDAFQGSIIQIASFSEESDADEFVTFMKQHFKNNRVWKGEPQ